MANIAGIACTFVKPLPGDPESYKQRLITWSQPGMSGEGNLIAGSGPGEWAYECVYFAVPTTVLAWGRSIEQLAGQIVSIQDDFGDTYISMLVKQVSPLRRTPALDGSGVYYLRGSIRVAGTRVSAG